MIRRYHCRHCDLCFLLLLLVFLFDISTSTSVATTNAAFVLPHQYQYHQPDPCRNKNKRKDHCYFRHHQVVSATRFASSASTASTAVSSKIAAPLNADSKSRKHTVASGSNANNGWFPTRIQDAILVDGSSSYEQLVPRLFLRHIVVETREMAQVALQMYHQELLHPSSDTILNDYDDTNNNNSNNSSFTSTTLLSFSRSDDPFGHVAQLLSVESRTASQGGTIGWVETSTSALTVATTNTTGSSSTTSTSTTTGASFSSSFPPEKGHDGSLLSAAVLRELVSKRPKAGDVFIIQDHDRNQWQVVQVAELWLRPHIFSSTNESTTTVTTTKTKKASIEDDGDDDDDVTVPTTDTSTSSSLIGAFGGHDRVLPRQRKLKGRGILPQFPSELLRYSIQTVGCQMNVADSERLAGILQKELGMRPATTPLVGEGEGGVAFRNNKEQDREEQYPDLIVWNTCSIRDRAEQKLYNAVGPFAAAKRRGGTNKNSVLVVTGCVAQQEGEQLLKRIPEIDAVVGPQYIPFLKNILELVSYGQQVVATSPMLIPEQDINVPPVRGHDVRAWVNVIYGCNEHCTYCVVPATRGTEQSRSMEAILTECLDLANRGYKEITLIGQNIDAYGRDMVPKRTFADLLVFLNARLLMAKTKMRIRYVTSHPRYFGQRVVDAVASLDLVCECFHMPFQAGDDEVLKRMRRGYTYDSYLKIIHRIRERAPDASITTDIIVGFPGETEEAFQKTLQLMEAVKFDNVNSFSYSPRPNTEAALWPDQIPDDVKDDRLQRVQRLAVQHGMERSLRYVGRIEEILVEDGNPRNPHQVMGRTRQGRQVYFDGDLTTLRGSFVNVRITEARPWSLMGEQQLAYCEEQAPQYQ